MIPSTQFWSCLPLGAPVLGTVTESPAGLIDALIGDTKSPPRSSRGALLPFWWAERSALLVTWVTFGLLDLSDCKFSTTPIGCDCVALWVGSLWNTLGWLIDGACTAEFCWANLGPCDWICWTVWSFTIPPFWLGLRDLDWLLFWSHSRTRRAACIRRFIWSECCHHRRRQAIER